jgi:hypothetical protein
MCGGGAPKTPPPQPPPQPPPVIESAPDVAIGNQSESVSKRKKVGRSSLKQTPSTAGKPASSGLGS